MQCQEGGLVRDEVGRAMKINRLFWLLTLAVIAIAVGAAVRMPLSRGHAYGRVSAAAEDLVAYRLALIAAEKVSWERGPANGLLGADLPVPADIDVGLGRARRETDAALAALLARLQPESKATDRAVVQGVIVQLGVARGRIDAVAQLPRPRRNPQFVAHAVASMFAAVDMLQPAISSVQADLVHAMPTSANQLVAARLLTEFREHAGRLGSRFTPALTLGQPLSGEQDAAADRDVGRIEELAELLATRIGNSDATRRAGLRKIEALYFGSGMDLVRQIREASRGRKPYGLSAANFAARYVPTMQPILDLRDAELARAGTQIDEALEQARFDLATAILFCLLLLAAILVLMLAFKRKVIQPVVAISRAITSEARGMPGFSRQQDDIANLQQGPQLLQAANAENLLLQDQREQALSFISHDMRAPLTAIIALIESRTDAASPQDEAATRERILRQTRRALALVDNYLELKQAESKTWETQEVDLREIIAEAVDDAWAFMNQRRVRIVHGEDEKRAWVRGNFWLLLRAISNLIHNAVKFSHELGEVRVDLAHEDACWKISVTDFGAGIPPNLIPRLFQPFQSIQEPGPYAGSGVGLGLAFVRTAVLRHGGDVSVTSTPEAGTTFVVTLPAAGSPVTA